MDIDCRIRMNLLEARARAAEVLSRSLEETQQENAVLRHHIAMYDDVLARLQNRLEAFSAAPAVPAASRSLVDHLLEKNQLLTLELLSVRQQLEPQVRLSRGVFGKKQ